MKQYLITTLLLLLNLPTTSWAQCTNDVTPPVASCRSITVVLDAVGSATVAAAAIDSNSTDNCLISIYLINGLPQVMFNCADIGSNTAFLTVIDSAGNADTCTANIIVVDVSAPSASCSTTTYYLNAAGVVVVPATAINNGSTDNCGIVNYLINGAAQDTFYSSDGGANVVTLTVQDASNNIQNCTAIVNIVDTLVPTVVCMDTTVYLDSNGQFMLYPSGVDGGSSDASGISNSKINGQDSIVLSTAAVGTIPVSLTVIDLFGNTNTCVASVTVVDTFSGTTSIALIDPQAIDLKLFPNPATEQLTLHVVEAVIEQVQLSSLTGQLLVEQVVQGATTVVLPVQQLPAGLYIVTIITDKGRVSQKLRVE